MVQDCAYLYTMSNAQNKSTMTFNTISTSDYGTFKTGSYTLNGQPYRVNGNCVGGQWSWTLAHDMSNHNNLREVKSHLLTLVGQDTQDMTTNNNLVNATDRVETPKQALQVMGMKVDNRNAFYFADTVRYANLPLDNCHVLNGTAVKSTAMWCKDTNTYLIRTKSEKA